MKKQLKKNMKKNTVMIGCAVVAAMIATSCGPTQKDAIRYNDELIGIERNLTTTHEGFINQLDAHNLDSLKIMQKVFAEKSKQALADCEKMKDFNGKRAYLDASIAYFKVINGLAEKECLQMTEILSKDADQITEEENDRLTMLVTKFDNDYEKELTKVQEAQKVFAAEWKFEIDNSK
ncbi:MAG: hypothetical protein JST26_00285 [Bacteroidetes bacterium]|nr:hypothetical protein [Bacteroidota bacterium]